jgi:enoyl-CoA hydratase/carnithine racemase
MCEAFRTMPKATIAVIEGRVGGGGSELALSCDMRFAALGQAVLNQPEVALGIIPGGTGTARLGRLAGRSRALEIILGCADFDAATAERFGWVNRALPPDELWPFVDRLAARIASAYPPTPWPPPRRRCCGPSGGGGGPPGRVARLRRHARDPSTQRAMARFSGWGQTVEGESRLGEVAGEIKAG